MVAVVVLVALAAAYSVFRATGQGQSAQAAVITCTPQHTISHWSVAPLDGGVYEMQTNEYNSSAAFSMCGDGDQNFKITQSEIDMPTPFDIPGGYPSIYRGCHWGDCTTNSGLPIQVSAMEADTRKVKLSLDTQVSASGVWDDAFDIFYTPCDDHGVSHSRCTQTTQPDREMMIWLSRNGPVSPVGKSTEVTIDGIDFTLWWDGSHTMTYVIRSPSLTNPHVKNLALGDFIKDAVNRGYIPSPSWYLMDIEAGFEIWQGGQGLQINSLSICTPTPAGCRG